MPAFFAGCVPDSSVPGGTVDLAIPPAPAGLSVAAPPVASDVVTRWSTVLSNGDPADVYLPVSPSAGGERLPVALLLQGANVDKSFYAGFAARVAAHGFVVVVPNHRGLLGLGLAALSEIAAVQQYAQEASRDPESPLFGRVDSGRLALIGHSFGGAAALHAVAGWCAIPFCTGEFTRPAELIGVVVYGSELRDPFSASDTPLLDNAGVPVLIIHGELDARASAAAVAETFEAVEDAPRAILTIAGANHFGINDINNPPGTVVDPNPLTLTQGESIYVIGTWAAQFLRGYGLGDEPAREFIGDAVAANDGTLEPVPMTQAEPP